MKVTLLGIPVDVDFDAPQDRIRLHPDLLMQIENQGIFVTQVIQGETVKNVCFDNSPLPLLSERKQ